MNLPRLSIRHPITTLMGMLILILLGAVSLINTPVDLLPKINPPVMGIMTTFTGASPQEVDSLVTQPIEAAVSTVQGVTNITSISSEHISLVVAEFGWGTDLNEARNDLSQALDRAPLPDGVTRPSIIKFDPTLLPVMQLSITSDVLDPEALSDLVRSEIAPRIESIEGVGAVGVTGATRREVQVLVDPDRLAEYELSLMQVITAIQGSQIAIPAGSVDDGDRTLGVRVITEADRLAALGDLVIKYEPPATGGSTSPFGNLSGALGGLMGGGLLGNLSGLGDAAALGNLMGGLTPPGPDWTPVRLSDVATIEVGSTQRSTINRTNGELALGLTIQKEGTANTLTVTRAIEKALAEIEDEFPHLRFHVYMNQGEFIDLAIDSVTQSLIVGAVLAAAILLFFLRNLRATLTVGVAIPFSVIVTFVLIYFQGLTINIMTLGGLALGVGMLVDNAIVVIENIYRWRTELGKPPAEAAERGANEVASAITASTLTTIAVFLPVVYVGGITGELFRELALTVTFSLLASLLVALTVVPMLASRWLGDKVTMTTTKRPERYLRMLRWGLGHRIALFAIVGALFVGSLALGTRLGTEFMPTPDEGVFSVTVSMPPGTSAEAVDRVLVQVSEAIHKHVPTATITTNAGTAEGFGGLAQAAAGGGAGSGRITVELADRRVSTAELVERLRADVLAAAGGAEVYFNLESQLASMGGGSSNSLQIFVSGPDADELREVVDRVVETLAGVPSISDITTNLEAVRPELQVRIDVAEATRLGLSPGLIGLTVSDALQGRVVGRLTVDGRPLDVRVGLAPGGRKDAAVLEELLLQTTLGQFVPLRDVAEVREEAGPRSITRQNQRPTVQVNALISGSDLGTATFEAMTALERLDLPPGYTASVGGASEMMSDSLSNLTIALIASILLIYMIMASLFESLRHPFIILFTMPLSLIGVVLGLFVTGYAIGVTAMIGFIILAGIVVNNGIVMVDFINQRRAEGMPLEEAIVESGRTRLRPILMTALTTMLGLVPMALGIGEGAEIMAPMAISVIGGLLTSTLLTLVVVPAVYRALHRETQVEGDAKSVKPAQ